MASPPHDERLASSSYYSQEKAYRIDGHRSPLISLGPVTEFPA
jgi:hypothetical protein